jgi:1,2-phenylacetyl-CoA epoxidase PaaB subunit
MYVIRYEKTLPPWLVSQDEVEADDPEDAVKEFYKRHDPMEDMVYSVYERTSMYTYQKVM